MFKIVEIETGDTVIEDRYLSNIASILDALIASYPGAYKLEWSEY